MPYGEELVELRRIAENTEPGVGGGDGATETTLAAVLAALDTVEEKLASIETKTNRNVSSVGQQRVAQSTSAVTLVSQNSNRTGFSIYNNSSANLYIAGGSGADPDYYIIKMAPESYFEFPAPVWRGQISGWWDASGSGYAQTAEYTY